MIHDLGPASTHVRHRRAGGRRRRVGGAPVSSAGCAGPHCDRSRAARWRPPRSRSRPLGRSRPPATEAPVRRRPSSRTSRCAAPSPSPRPRPPSTAERSARSPARSATHSAPSRRCPGSRRSRAACRTSTCAARRRATPGTSSTACACRASFTWASARPCSTQRSSTRSSCTAAATPRASGASRAGSSARTSFPPPHDRAPTGRYDSSTPARSWRPRSRPFLRRTRTPVSSPRDRPSCPAATATRGCCSRSSPPTRRSRTGTTRRA